jgi:uncharacterized glyoxalase superfamily protein PhnB
MPQVKPIPEGMSAVTPHLICAKATEALDFYKRAFGAKEESRLPGPDGKLMHGMIRIGGAPIMLTEENAQYGALGPKTLKGSPVTIHLYVPDVDKFVEHATRAGAKVRMAVQDMFWGDRYGTLEDPYGHVWSIATHQREVTPDQMRAAMEDMAKQQKQQA